MFQFSDSGFLYPLFMAIVSAILTATMISFTKPNSEIRILVAILVSIMTFEVHQTLGSCFENRLWKALISTAMYIQCLQSLDNLCLTRISYEKGTTSPAKAFLQISRANGHTSTNGKATKSSNAKPILSLNSMLTRISWGFSMLWNMRAVLTPWSIKNIPPFLRNKEEFLPARRKFLLSHLGTIVIASVILDVFAQQSPPDVENAMSQKQQAFFSRLSDITVEELIFRMFAVLGFWISTACTVSLLNSSFAVLHVGLGLQDPISWPPIFGKISEAYSIRQFWGVTWHQTLRRSLTSISDFIVTSVLNIKKGSLLSRYLKLFLCFSISGCLHFVADLALGIPTAESGALQFFVITSLGIMFEDGVQEMTRRIFGRGPSSWRSFVGYLWVLCFMLWTIPTWAYPAARSVRPGRDVLLPFSIIEVGEYLLK